MIQETAEVVLQARGLGRHFASPEGNIAILQSLDLTLPAGEVLAVLGASGSGKSTLLALLAGLDQADAGEVELLGQSLGTLDEDRRAALRLGRVGFIFQDFQLIPGFNALENVMLPLELAGRGQPRRRALEALEAVGLAARRHHRPNQLSGGEQQRVAIARAFAAEPVLLLADEPTGNLDSATGEKIIDLLFDLRGRLGTALLLVTHDQALARRCDRRLWLADGRLETAP